MTVKAILHIFVEPGKLEDVGEALAKMPEVIDVYEVTGEYDIIATAKTNDLHQLRSLISEKLMKMHGVKAVTTSVVLHIYKINGKEVFESVHFHLQPGVGPCGDIPAPFPTAT